MVQFVQDGVITADGQKAISYLESLINGAMDDLAKLNNLPGYAQHYHMNVLAAKLMSPAQWLEDYRSNGAKAAYDYAVALEEAANQTAQQTEQSNKIAEALEAIQKELADARAEIKALQESKKPGKKQAAKVEPEHEEAADAESEA